MQQRHQVLIVASILTGLILWWYLNRREADRREAKISHYRDQIAEIDISIGHAELDLRYAETLIEKTEARRRLANLKQERRTYITKIREAK